MGSVYTSMAPDPYDKGPDIQMSKGKLAVLAIATALIATALIPASAGALKVHRAVALGTSTSTAWAPAGSATIHPGVQVFTEGAQCTSNFVFQEGAEVYLGQAAHCSGTGGSTETEGCKSGSLPVGTPVEVSGAARPGTLAYNSWLAMQGSGESNPDSCAYNDFALIRIDPADVGSVNPSVPGFGGPTAVGTVNGSIGETVYSYGNSELRLGVTSSAPSRASSS